MGNNNPEEQPEEPYAVITWMDRERTKYKVSDLPAYRKSTGGQGYLYFRIDRKNNTRYEKPADIEIIYPKKRKLKGA